jgi:hypothetical protein
MVNLTAELATDLKAQTPEWSWHGGISPMSGESVMQAEEQAAIACHLARQQDSLAKIWDKHLASKT